MIQTIIEALDLAAAQTLPVVTRHGLSERRGNAVYSYAGDGQWLPVNNDNGGTYSYWRLTGTVDEVSVDGTSCNNDFQATYRLRLVCRVDREICPNVIDAARSTMSQLRGSDDDIRQTLKLRRVNIDTARLNVDSPSVFQQEFGMTGDILPSQMLLAIDVTVVAIGKAECFMPCGTSTSLLCQTIAAATWAKIKACMSDAQVDAAISDLCETGPCPPTTVNGTESDVPDITVLRGGVEIGTLNPATGVHTVPECEEPVCDPMTVSLGGVQVVNQSDPCGVDVELECSDLVDAVVVEDAGTEEVNGLYLNNPSAPVPDTPFPGSSIYGKSGFTIYRLALDYGEFGGCWDFFQEVGEETAYRSIDTDKESPWDVEEWAISSTGVVPIPTVRQATIGDICATPCAPATLSVNDTLVDTAADPCGHAFSLVVKNEDDTQVGSLVDGEWIVPTAKSLCALVTEGTAEEVAICVISSGKRAGVLAELIPTVPDGDVVAQVYDVMTVDQQAIIRDLFLFIKFVWQAGDADTYLWTVTADEAGTFTTYTPTGTNGTLTYSLNGGGYAALSGTIVLAVNDTITVRRTTTTNAGSVKWEP